MVLGEDEVLINGMVVYQNIGAPGTLPLHRMIRMYYQFNRKIGYQRSAR